MHPFPHKFWTGGVTCFLHWWLWPPSIHTSTNHIKSLSHLFLSLSEKDRNLFSCGCPICPLPIIWHPYSNNALHYSNLANHLLCIFISNKLHNSFFTQPFHNSHLKLYYISLSTELATSYYYPIIFIYFSFCNKSYF